MVGGQADVKLVSNAMANATRRKIMTMLVEKERTREEIEQAAGATMLDYHLQMLQQAGLAEPRAPASQGLRCGPEALPLHWRAVVPKRTELLRGLARLLSE